MDATEIKIIKGIAKNLKDSANVTWMSGDINKWADHAKKMEQSIKDAAKLLETLVAEDEKQEGLKL